MMTGDKLSANDAYQMGMLYKVFSDELFVAETMKMAVNLSLMPTKGIGYTKRLLNESAYNTYDKQLQFESFMQTEAAATHDYKEGVNAFLEKRKPEFRGE